MDARSPATLLFVLLVPACRQIESGTTAPPSDRSDPRLAHAREAEPWRRFDANLDMLYRSRRTMRLGVVLPDEPALENEIQGAAWAAAKAAERSRLADMIHQETLNDLEHSRQAVELAEAQVKLAREAHDETLDDLAATVRRLRQVILDGDVEHNLRVLRRFVEALPETHRSTLLGVARTDGS